MMAIRTNKSVTDNQQGRGYFHRKGVINPEKKLRKHPTDIPGWCERKSYHGIPETLSLGGPHQMTHY